MSEEKHPSRKSFFCPFCKRKQTLLAVSWELVHAQLVMHFNVCVPPDVNRDTASIMAAAKDLADALAGPQKK